MPRIDVIGNGDGCWPDLAEKLANGRVIELMGKDAPPIGMALLKHGMTSGRASVTIRIELPDGRSLLTETSLALLKQAVGIFTLIAEKEGTN